MGDDPSECEKRARGLMSIASVAHDKFEWVQYSRCEVFMFLVQFSYATLHHASKSSYSMFTVNAKIYLIPRCYFLVKIKSECLFNTNIFYRSSCR